MKGLINWSDFEKVDLRAGTIVDVRPIEKAKKPAWTLIIDFRDQFGAKKSSAQIIPYRMALNFSNFKTWNYQKYRRQLNQST